MKLAGTMGMTWLALAGLMAGAAPVAAQPVALVTAAADGTASSGGEHGIISADGRFVAFNSTAANLVAGLNPAPPNGVYLRDLQTATTTLVSVGTNGEAAPGGGLAQAVSADGRFVLFQTVSPLVPEDTNATQCTRFIGEGLTQPGPCVDLYVRDRQTNQTELISRSTAGVVGNSDSQFGSMTADGRYVVFLSASTNLASPPATPEKMSAFLRDRSTNTTTRLDLPLPVAGDSQLLQEAAISADGSTILYIRSAGTANATLCPDASCDVATLLDRSSDTTQTMQLSPLPPNVQAHQTLKIAGLSADGRYALLHRTLVGAVPDGAVVPRFGYSEILYDRQQTRVLASLALPGSLGSRFNQPNATLRADGHGLFYKMPSERDGRDVMLLYYDLQTAQATPVLRLQTTPLRDIGFVTSSADGSRVAIEAFGDLGIAVPGNSTQVYTFRIDSDGDGMSDAWETEFGLNPADPGDAAADPDHDGLTNLQEYQQGGHPTAHFTRYFAEGSSNEVFSTRIALLNPGNAPATVVARYLGTDGAAIPSQTLVMPPRSRMTIDDIDLPLGPTSDFSTIIESDVPVVAERTFDVRGVGHGEQGETAIAQPSTTWFFAEGATGGPFSLFYELQNPGDVQAQVTVNYLLPAPQAPLTKTYTLAARSRRTIWVDAEDPRLASNDVSAHITSDQPIVAERSLYLASLGQPLGGLAGGAGVTAPATRWFMAEGATGPFFDLYVLLANPNAEPADVTLTYLLPDGTHFAKSYPVAGQSRLTVLVDGEDDRLINTPVSVIAESTNNVPIIAERAMWWPQGNWYEGHSSVGATVTSRKWALAEGEVGFSPFVATYVMIANVSNVAGTATVELVQERSTTPHTLTLNLPANSRTTVSVDQALFETSLNVRFGVIVTSPDVDLVVEHALYRNPTGIIWGAGTAALGEPIP